MFRNMGLKIGGYLKGEAVMAIPNLLTPRMVFEVDGGSLQRIGRRGMWEEEETWKSAENKK